MEFEIQDLDLKFNTYFKTTPEGYLNPVVTNADIKFGKTKIYHDDWFLALVFDQWIKLMMIIVQNAVYFMGEYIFSGMFEPILTRYMQQYKIPIHLGEAFHGQSGQDDFHLDIRNIYPPYIGDGYMDMYLVGETWY